MGTTVRVPLENRSDGKIPFGGAAAFERGYLPVWSLEGTIDRQVVEIDGSISVEETLEISSSPIESTNKLQAFPGFRLERLSGPEGNPSIPTSFFASSLLTPTDFPIERHPVRNAFNEVPTVELEVQESGRLQGTFTSTVPLPDDLPAGYYRLKASVEFSEIPPLEKSNNLVNPSSRQTATGNTRLFDGDGNPLQVAINDEVQEGSFSFQVPASAAGFFETDGSGALMSGSGQLTSNRPVGGTVLFSGDFGVAGVGVVRPLRNFLVPIEADPSPGVSTGLTFPVSGGVCRSVHRSR